MFFETNRVRRAFEGLGSRVFEWVRNTSTGFTIHLLGGSWNVIPKALLSGPGRAGSGFMISGPPCMTFCMRILSWGFEKSNDLGIAWFRV